MELVAFIGSDTENWGQITALLKHMSWDSAILVKGKNTHNFPKTDNAAILEIDTSKPLAEITSILKEKLKSRLSGEFEVALSLASGSGKEHMALISALLNVPVGIKLAVFTKKGIEFIT